MVPNDNMHSPERLAILSWIVRLGAVTSDALALHEGCTPASARARLTAAERAGLLICRRVLVGEPPLYAATPAGLRATRLSGFEPCRISVANAPHTIACARVAAALERAYPDHRVMGERELRREERDSATPLASACLGVGPAGAPLLHRPDLVLWPEDRGMGLPVAVEVELTVKAPRRLLEICRAWARCRCVAGTLYLAAEEVMRPLARAVERSRAGERIVVLEIEAIGDPPPEKSRPESLVPGDA
jgi:GNAT superfamily N-acetyltransferase